MIGDNVWGNGEVLGEMWFMRMMWVCSEMVVLVMVENGIAGLWMGMVILEWLRMVMLVVVKNGNTGNGNVAGIRE